MSKVTFTPEEPVVYDGKTYTVLTLRKMKARDLVNGDLVIGGARKSFAILASIADVPMGVIEELSIDDYEELSEVAAPLMGKSAMAAIAKAKAEAEKAEATEAAALSSL